MAMASSKQPPTSTSVVDTLPDIDFRFDDLRARMAKFTAQFDQFVAQSRKKVLEERNKFHTSVTELQGKPSLLRFVAGAGRLVGERAASLVCRIDDDTHTHTHTLTTTPT